MNMLLNKVDKGIESVQKAAYILMALTGVSFVFALIRNKLLASNIGADQILDVYFAAFRIPDLIFILSILFVSSYTLIPFFENPRFKEKDVLKTFINSIFSFYTLVILGVSVLAFISMPYLVEVFFSGFDASQLVTLTEVSRILLLQAIFMSLSAFLSSIIQYKRRFIIYGLLPIFYNLGIILGIVFFFPYFGLEGLVWGVVLGAGLHLLIQVPSVVKSDLLPTIRRNLGNFKEIFEVVKSSIPRALSYSFNSLTIFGLISLTAYLSDGLITIFSFAEDLHKIPVALIGSAYSIAIFPMIAKHYANGRLSEMKDEILSVFKRLSFFVIPVVVFAFILREPIVTLLLGGERFGNTEILITQGIFSILLISTVAWIFMLVFARIFYAIHNIAPFVIFGIVMFLTVYGSSLFVFDKLNYSFIENLSGFLNVPLSGVGIIEIGVVKVTAEIIGLIIFILVFRKVCKFSAFKGSGVIFRNQIIANILAGIVMYYTYVSLLGTSENIYLDSILSISVVSIVGILIWFVTLKLLKDIELEKFVSKLK